MSLPSRKMSHSTGSLPAATALRTDSPAAFMRIFVSGSTAVPRPPRAPPRPPPVLRGAFGSPEAVRVEVVADAAGLPVIATSGGLDLGLDRVDLLLKRRQLPADRFLHRGQLLPLDFELRVDLLKVLVAALDLLQQLHRLVFDLVAVHFLRVDFDEEGLIFLVV